MFYREILSLFHKLFWLISSFLLANIFLGLVRCMLLYSIWVLSKDDLEIFPIELVRRVLGDTILLSNGT